MFVSSTFRYFSSLGPSIFLDIPTYSMEILPYIFLSPFHSVQGYHAVKPEKQFVSIVTVKYVYAWWRSCERVMRQMEGSSYEP